MTSLIQACKILTALLALNNSSSLLCCPPSLQPFSPLHLSTSSLFLSTSSSLFMLPLISLASMFHPEHRHLKCEVSINPVACKSFCLLQWLPQAKRWWHWSDWHSRTHSHKHDTVHLHVRLGWDKMAGNRKLIYLSVGALTHAHTCT